MVANLALREEGLNAFDPQARRTVLQELATEGCPAAAAQHVNMHVHSFFSYNALGWSPSRIAWEGRKAGLTAVGLIDFDVLDGMEEFYQAGELLGVRTSVGVETRTFYADYADKEIDSPGEPGVHYVDGLGFTQCFAPGTPQAMELARYRQTAQERNRALIARINPQAPDIALDYDNDVQPLSPGHCPTERHIITAYIKMAAARFSGDRLVDFWADVLHLEAATVRALLANQPAMEEKVRARFAKRGGLGYVQPTAETFPPLAQFFAWVKSCCAIPTESWLDGTSEGEADARALLECSVAHGACALNIIPDRNWNIADPAIQAVKVKKLRRIVALADAMQLPINIGTEMNRLGQPVADDLAGPVLQEFAASFRTGALVIVGHAICARFAGFPYVGEAADAEFTSRGAKNAFFAAVGALPPVDLTLADRLRAMGSTHAYAVIRDSVRQGTWR